MKIFFAVCALVDGLLLYGVCRLFGFSPNIWAIAICVAGAYAILDYKASKRMGA